MDKINSQEIELIEWGEIVGIVGVALLVSFMVIIVVGGIHLMDVSIRKDVSDNTKEGICTTSGFDGYERVREVDYCYVGKGLDTVLVPLIISLPESGEE